MLIDLSHRITDGMVTYPGLPAPMIGTHLSREAAEELYGPGLTFHIGLLTMCTNTGTYIDVPFHRYADGHDLADLELERVASLPAVVLDRRGIQTIDLEASDVAGLAGHVEALVGHGATQTLSEHPMVVSQHETDRHGRTRYVAEHGPAGRRRQF